MTCTTCFSDYLVKCPDGIQVNVFLEPNSAYLQYKWVITDKFNNAYEGYFVTDEQGHFLIPVDDLPEGLLTEFSGEFKLEVFSEDNVKLDLMIAQVYDCISFDVKGGTLVKNDLGFPFNPIVT